MVILSSCYAAPIEIDSKGCRSGEVPALEVYEEAMIDISEPELVDAVRESAEDADSIFDGLTFPQDCNVKLDLSYEETVFEKINAARIEKGMHPLVLNESLTLAARQHSIDMACNNYFRHTNLEGETFEDRVLAQDYEHAGVGEVIYAGDKHYNTPESAYRWLYNSPKHYYVMFDRIVIEIGLGYAYCPDSRYGGYFTADLAKPAE